MKDVTLKLTIHQARAMRHALGNTTEYADVMDNVFAHKPAQRRCLEALAELDKAIRKAVRG